MTAGTNRNDCQAVEGAEISVCTAMFAEHTEIIVGKQCQFSAVNKICKQIAMTFKQLQVQRFPYALRRLLSIQCEGSNE